MGPVQRRAFCAGRFVARVPLHGKRVLLIDDVVTSGSQAREAIRALHAAGAADWRFVALARATAAPGEDETNLRRLGTRSASTGGG